MLMPRNVKTLSALCAYTVIAQWGIICGVEAIFISMFATSSAFSSAYGDPSPGTRGLLTAMYPLAAAVGCLAMVAMLRLISPKFVIVLATYVWLGGYLLACFVPTQAALLVARFIKGISVGLATSAIPLYVDGLDSQEWANNLLVVFQSAFPLGIIVASVVALVGNVLHGLAFQYCWLLSVALSASAPILTLLLPTSDASRAKPPSLRKEFGSLVRNITAGKRLGWATFVQASVQLTGVNVMLYYMGNICEMMGLDDNLTAYLCLGLYCCLFLGTGASLGFVNRINLLSGMRNCSIVMALLHGCTYYALLFNKVDLVHRTGRNYCGVAALVMCYVFMLVYATLFAGTSYVYTAHLAQTCSPNIGMGIAIGAGWMVNAAISYIAPLCMYYIGLNTFLVFATLCSAIYVVFTVMKNSVSWSPGPSPRLSPDGKNAVVFY